VKGAEIDDEEEFEDEELEGYETPPSSPLKENKRVPRSLTRPGAIKLVRQVQNLRTRVEELQGCELSPKYSFFVSDWNFEFGDDTHRVLKEVDPEQNTLVLLNRVN